ncbi:MAG: formate dehydrogenase accessory sulfurtransferase FdhD [Paracoccaceae bacterium]
MSMAGRIANVLADEVPIALVFNGTTQAVMMATPDDLEDFAIGFALSDHVIHSRDEIESIEILPAGDGIEARVWLAEGAAEALEARRRRMAGPVGCGLCGMDSIAEALHPIKPVRGEMEMSGADIAGAMAALRAGQVLHAQTGSTHAAGLWRADRPMIIREDIGRHNALDKLIGASHGALGAVVMSSRISVDLVQKCAGLGAPILIAASAPTAHAVRLADQAGITLVGFARGANFTAFSHPHRITAAGDPA